MTTPAIGAIREHFPQAEITLLANSLVAELFSPHEWVDRVITFDRNCAHHGIRGRLRLAASLRKEKFDATVILPNSFDSALVPWLAGIPIRIGKSSDGRGFMLTERFKPDKQAHFGHEVEYYLGLVSSFGIISQLKTPQLTLTSAEDMDTAARLAEHGIHPGDCILGINPGAAYGSAKRWYPDRFAEVARQLADKWSAKVLIFGGQGETDIAAEIEQQLGRNCLNLAGKTSVRELLALIRRCSFFITNDSGPMHVAAALGVPLVAIFGPTDHATTSPYAQKAYIVRNHIECAPCKLRKCPTDHQCMSGITVDQVVEAALKLSLT